MTVGRTDAVRFGVAADCQVGLGRSEDRPLRGDVYAWRASTRRR